MKLKKLLIIVLFLSLIFVSGCQIGKRTITNKEDFGLSTVSDEAELKSLLKKTNDNFLSGFFGFFRGGLESVSPESPAMDDSAEKSTNDYTKTNVQVEGVDEGDIVKTDGNRIYSINHNTLQVVGILGNGDMELLLFERLSDETNYSSYTYYSALYVTDKYFVVIGQNYQYYAYDSYNKDDSPEPFFRYRSTQTSFVLVYDVVTLNQIDKYEVSGYLLSSRLIDNNLYLISNYYAYNYNDEYDPRPWITHNDDTDFVAYRDIKYLPDMIYQGFTIITNVNLDTEITYKNNIFLGSQSWGQIYVSLNAIYFATTYYEQSMFGNYSQKGKLISYQFSSNGEVIYGGAGTFLGYIINQFAMDEYNGYMRIVTTEGWGDSVKNRLYVFEKKVQKDAYVLEVVGSIFEGLGKPRERVQSVRFNKDKATVVTFEQIDPFYTIDLSDPKKPIIRGELEVTGFSVYQHPWSDTLVIGIGFESIDNMITGMKLALYDISDFDNPVEVGKPLVLSNDNGWNYSEALYNHKAILIDKSHNSIGFSLWRSNWSNGFYSSINDYLVFDIDETKEQPISIKHTISHIDYYSNDLERYPDYYGYYNFNIVRAIRIDNHLYVVSGEVVTSHNLVGEFSTVDVIIFKQDAKNIK